MPQKITLAGLTQMTATMAAISSKPLHVGGGYRW